MKKLAMIMAVVAVMAVGQVAQADFVAYNDCVNVGGSATNTTLYSALGVSGEVTAGLLKDFATGNNTAVTATITGSNICRAGTAVLPPASGTDAHNTFNGKVGMTGYNASYNSSSLSWSYQVVFTGLDSSKTYEFVTTANRDKSAYGGTTTTSRWSKFSIIGADNYANNSSIGVVEISADAVKMNTGYNTVNGYVVKWTGIEAGTDGSFTVLSQNAGSPGEPNKAYGMRGFMLTEVPEPATMCLLGLGGISVLIRKRRKA